jgi:ADP-ribosylglycohydrolase
MVAGALYGVSALPKRWAKRLDPEISSEVLELSDYLVNHSLLGHRR